VLAAAGGAWEVAQLQDVGFYYAVPGQPSTRQFRKVAARGCRLARKQL
jgi:hypothetical protein